MNLKQEKAAIRADEFSRLKKGLYMKSIFLTISCIKKEASNFVCMKTDNAKVHYSAGLKRSRIGNK